jgi:hypothetical protein
MALPLALPASVYLPDVVSPARVQRLFTRCICGRDLGDHLVDPPHAGDPLSGSRPCRAFRAAASRKHSHPGGTRRGGSQ